MLGEFEADLNHRQAAMDHFRKALELTTLKYELGVPAAQAVERLTPLAMPRGEAHVTDEAYDTTGALSSATLTRIKTGNRQMKDWANTTLGTLRADEFATHRGNQLCAGTPRIQKEIAKHLGPAPTRRHDGHGYL